MSVPSPREECRRYPTQSTRHAIGPHQPLSPPPLLMKALCCQSAMAAVTSHSKTRSVKWQPFYLLMVSWVSNVGRAELGSSPAGPTSRGCSCPVAELKLDGLGWLHPHGWQGLHPGAGCWLGCHAMPRTLAWASHMTVFVGGPLRSSPEVTSCHFCFLVVKASHRPRSGGVGSTS